MKRIIKDEKELQVYANEFVKQLKPGMLITLSGELGAGKTTFVRCVLSALGYQGKVKSPTYTLVETYDIHGQSYCHFDLYRLHDPQELEYIGFRDYLNEQNICFIEWPEKAGKLLPKADIHAVLTVDGESRLLDLS